MKTTTGASTMKRALIFAAALLATTSAARADTVVNVDGTIAGYTFVETFGWQAVPLVDTTGVFGQAGHTLSGDAFHVSWTFNNAVLQAGTLTINGASISYGHGLSDLIFVDPHQIYAGVTVNLGGLADGLSMNTYVTTTPTHITFPGLTSFSYTVDPITDNLSAPFGLGGGFLFHGLNGFFYPTTFEIIVDGITGPNLSVPGPVIGAGLPGLVALLAGWWLARRRGMQPARR